MHSNDDLPTRETLDHVVVEGQTWPIVIDQTARRFEIRVGENLSIITFSLVGSALSLLHTEVAPALRGHGVAESLARAALTYARNHGMTVKPFCPYVAGYIRRHREFEPLIDADVSTDAALAKGSGD